MRGSAAMSARARHIARAQTQPTIQRHKYSAGSLKREGRNRILGGLKCACKESNSSGKPKEYEPRGESGAPDGALDPDLRVVLGVWSKLPPAVRAGIVAMVKATGGVA